VENNNAPTGTPTSSIAFAGSPSTRNSSGKKLARSKESSNMISLRTEMKRDDDANTNDSDRSLSPQKPIILPSDTRAEALRKSQAYLKTIMKDMTSLREKITTLEEAP
jgi:hypothetical protein